MIQEYKKILSDKNESAFQAAIFKKRNLDIGKAKASIFLRKIQIGRKNKLKFLKINVMCIFCSRQEMKIDEQNPPTDLTFND